MYRVDTITAAANMPDINTPGTPGYFTQAVVDEMLVKINYVTF